MNANDIWHATLSELELQMTKATFDTWVRPSHAVSLSGEELVVQVHSPYAKEWLENRLKTTIERTLTGVVGRATHIQYVVANGHENGSGHRQGPEPTPPTTDVETEPESAPDPAPAEVQVTLIEKPQNDFIIVPRYDFLFWQPLLGSATFSTFLLLRAAAREYKVAWGKTKRIRVDLLAASQGVHRQTLTGRKREGQWLKGTFDHLNDARIARIAIVGKDRDVMYDARILHELPLLAPAQVALLDPLLQVFHTQYLKEFDIDSVKWEQLEIPSLVVE